jgi:hypothetical protein
MDVLTAAAGVGNAPEGKRTQLSVVVPVYNEEAVLPEFHRRLTSVLERLPVDAEIIYVNDGSADRTMALLTELHRVDPRVVVLELSRNFGKENAMSAGLDHARGDATVIIDADLQDPPELIPQMIAAWHAGHDVVLMRRKSRAQESFLKRASARVFYKTIGRFGAINIPENIGDFRLLSRRAVDAMRCFSAAQPFKGALRVDRILLPGDRIRSCGSRGRNDQVELLAIVELRHRGHHLVLRSAAETCELRWFGDGHHFLRVRRVRDRQDHSVRRPGPRLPDARRPGAVPGRHPADGAGHHRRISGALFIEVKQALPMVQRHRCRPPAELMMRDRRGRMKLTRIRAATLPLCLVILMIAIRAVTLGAYPLLDPSESRYAEIARKMLETGVWLVPQFDYGVPFWGKPPLAFWLSAMSMRVFGINEFGARLPSLLLMGGCGVLIYQLARVHAGRDAALLTIVVFATTGLVFIAAGAVLTDQALTLGTTLCMAGFWMALHGPAPTRRVGVGFFLDLQVGLLAKGPVAVVLTLFPIALWVLWNRQWRKAWSCLP